MEAGHPDFNNLLAVLRCEAPERPTLFEFYTNDPLMKKVTGTEEEGPGLTVQAFLKTGYDYATILVPGFAFPSGEVETRRTYSLNQGGLIRDSASFEAYPWPDADTGRYGLLDELAETVPDGMKLVVCGPMGVEEIAVRLVGYESLCYMMADDPGLTEAVFSAIGSRLVRYYERCAPHPAVGALISNDDWGFKTGPLFSLETMERYVFPWHRKIVEAIHAAGKPAILHSCGNLEAVMDVIIDDLNYDGKHSFEDAILPVEEAYEKYCGRIAILGGIDLDFVCRSTPDAVYQRSKAMVERAADRGGFALGTGNSVPDYVPDENYFAMLRAALEGR